MDDYSAVIEAIDRLTAAVNQPSNSFVAECLSTVLATVGSVVAVLIFELIKNEILAPRDDVIAFADERKSKNCCGIAVNDIREAGSLLIGLSNSFFATGDSSELNYTKKREEDIKRLLGIAKEA